LARRLAALAPGATFHITWQISGRSSATNAPRAAKPAIALFSVGLAELSIDDSETAGIIHGVSCAQRVPGGIVLSTAGQHGLMKAVNCQSRQCGVPAEEFCLEAFSSLYGASLSIRPSSVLLAGQCHL
jgi:hypothetical protein